jgi:hypothetical protein
MGFAEWKKRSKAYTDAAGRIGYNNMSRIVELERACAAAYKAGERDGRKVAEAVAMNAIILGQQLGA